MNDQKKAKLNHYMQVVSKYKDKLDGEDFFLLGLIFGNFTKEVKDVNQVRYTNHSCF
jgi:hypothetical protein